MNGKLKSQQLEVRCISIGTCFGHVVARARNAHLSNFKSSTSSMVQNFFHQERMGYSCGHWKRVSIFHLQPRCKRGIYASGIGTTLVGSKFSQSSGRLRGLGLAYSPNKGGWFLFCQWCNDGATQISYLSDLSRNYVENGWKWSQGNFWCRNVTTWDYLPWISRL